MPFSYSIDLRDKVVTALEMGRGSIAEISRFFGVSEWSVREWSKRKQQTNSLEPLPNPGQDSIVCDDSKEYITQRILDEPTVKLLTLCEELESKFQISISESWMCKIVKKLGFKRKKLQLLPSEQLTEALKKKARRFS